MDLPAVIDERWWLNCTLTGSGVRLYDLSAEEPFARTVARDRPEVVHALFDIAGEDAEGGFPEWLLNVSERSAGAPGRIDMPPRG